jgi:hypothetical protein
LDVVAPGSGSGFLGENIINSRVETRKSLEGQAVGFLLRDTQGVLCFVSWEDGACNGSGVHDWMGSVSGQICLLYVCILGLAWPTKARRLAKDAFRLRRDSQESRSLCLRSRQKKQRLAIGFTGKAIRSIQSGPIGRNNRQEAFRKPARSGSQETRAAGTRKGCRRGCEGGQSKTTRDPRST